MSKSVQVAVRVDQETVTLADQVVTLVMDVTGVRPTRSQVMRQAMESGLAAMRTETAKKATRKRKS